MTKKMQIFTNIWLVIIGLILLFITGCEPKQVENKGKLVLIDYYREVYEDERVPEKDILTRFRVDSAYLYKVVKKDTLSFMFIRNNFVTDSADLYKEIKNDTVHFIYKAGKHVLYDTLFMNSNNNSLWWGNRCKCLFVADKTFRINDCDMTVTKYYYNEEQVRDEEFYFFFHPEYGLLLTKSAFFGQGLMTFSMEHDTVSRMLIDSIICDRDFFNLWYFRPPLPSP